MLYPLIYKTKYVFTKIHRYQTSKPIDINTNQKIIKQKNLYSAIKDSIDNDFSVFKWYLLLQVLEKLYIHL